MHGPALSIYSAPVRGSDWLKSPHSCMGSSYWAEFTPATTHLSLSLAPPPSPGAISYAGGYLALSSRVQGVPAPRARSQESSVTSAVAAPNNTVILDESLPLSSADWVQ